MKAVNHATLQLVIAFATTSLLQACGAAGGGVEENDALPDVEPAPEAPSEPAEPRPTPNVTQPATGGGAALLAQVDFDDGNVLRFQSVGGGVLITESGYVGNGPHYRPSNESLSAVFRSFVDGEVPEVLVRIDAGRAALGALGAHEGQLGISPQREGLRNPVLDERLSPLPDVGLAGESGGLEQTAGRFPATSFLADLCRDDPEADHEYTLTGLSRPDSQSFLQTYRSYTAIAADRGDVRAAFSTAIPEFGDDPVTQEVREGGFTTHDFIADVFSEGGCLPAGLRDEFPFFSFTEDCAPDLIFQREGPVTHSVDEVASTDRYHFCGFFARIR